MADVDNRNVPPPDGTPPTAQEPAYPDGPVADKLCRVKIPSINPLDYLPEVQLPPIPVPEIPSLPNLGSLPFTIFDCSKRNPTKIPTTYGGGRKGTKPPNNTTE